MAYFCLSHNHSDFHSLMALVIGKTLGYEDTIVYGGSSSTGSIKTVTSPYKDYYVRFGWTTQSAFNAASNKATHLAGLLSDHINENVTNNGTDDGRPSYSHTDLLWYAGGDASNAVYGDIHFEGGVDSGATITTTTYDNIVGVTDSKVIHCTWSDWTHSSWTTDFKARVKAIDSNLTDERFGHYETAMKAITYPNNSDNFVLYQDKILDKDEAHYTALCTFLGATELSASVWKGYVDAYKTYISS